MAEVSRESFVAMNDGFVNQERSDRDLSQFKKLARLSSNFLIQISNTFGKSGCRFDCESVSKRREIFPRRLNLNQYKFNNFETTLRLITITSIILMSHKASITGGFRMVRLCIASVDSLKLSSQCVMCNRREFPLTVIDCTGITKVHDLIANPLSVQEATCLIYNCRRQVPNIRPEPYHGSVSQAANYPSASRVRPYEVMAPSPQLIPSFQSTYPIASAQYNPYLTPAGAIVTSPSTLTTTGSLAANPLDLIKARQQTVPYSLMHAPAAFGYGKYKTALVPLFA